jgi:hypothetical protein
VFDSEDEEDEDPNDLSSETLKALLAEEDIAPIAFYQLDKEGMWSVFPPHQSEYVAFTVIVDLDRQIFTVNGTMHYDLYDIPPNWRDDPEEEAHLISFNKFVYHPPPLDDKYLDLWNSITCETCLMAPPQRRTDIRLAIMDDMLADFSERYQYLLNEFANQWGPLDIQFRSLVYAMIKLASNSFRFRLCEDRLYSTFHPAYDRGDFLKGYKVPSTDMYYVHGTDGVVVHLSSQLDLDYRRAICRVVKCVKKSGKQETSACIISLYHVIVLNVTNENGKVHVKHSPLASLSSRTGRKLLISVLNPDRIEDASYTLDANLPAEIIAAIFKHLFLLPGGVKALPCWRLVCKAFNGLARKHVLQLPGLSILDWADFDDYKRYHGVNKAGEVGIWTRRDPFWRKRRELQWGAVPARDELRGLALGCGFFTLWEIDPEFEDDVLSISSTDTDCGFASA